MNQPLKKFRAGQVSCALWEDGAASVPSSLWSLLTVELSLAAPKRLIRHSTVWIRFLTRGCGEEAAGRAGDGTRDGYGFARSTRAFLLARS